MILLLIKNLKIMLLKISVWLVSFLLIVVVFFFFSFFQVEIILYFYPDILLLNLNELFLNDLNLTLSNKFAALKGYIFVDPDYFHKNSLLVGSYGVIKYKKYSRHLKILKAVARKMRKRSVDRMYIPEDLPFIQTKEPKSRFYSRKYRKSKFIRYLLTLDERAARFNWLLFKELLSMSTFSQKLWFIFWEFKELDNIEVRKRKFYQRMNTIRKMLHSYPSEVVNVVTKYTTFLHYSNPQILRQFYTPDYKSSFYNRIGVNYNYYAIYKKFSKQIYYNFFSDAMPPYRFYEIYLKKRQGSGVVWRDFFYSRFKKKSPTYYDVNRNSYETEYGKEVGARGFNKNKKFFPMKEKETPRYRFRFHNFYNEKYLVSPMSFADKKLVRFAVHHKPWGFEKILTDAFLMKGHYAEAGTIIHNAYDLRSRGNYWKRVYSRYGYRKNDYIFFNYDLFFFFKKYYIPILNDLFVFPSFFKNLNFFDMLLKNYYKLNNFFMFFFNKNSYFFYYKMYMDRVAGHNNYRSGFFKVYKADLANFKFDNSFFFFISSIVFIVFQKLCYMFILFFFFFVKVCSDLWFFVMRSFRLNVIYRAFCNLYFIMAKLYKVIFGIIVGKIEHNFIGPVKLYFEPKTWKFTDKEIKRMPPEVQITVERKKFMIYVVKRVIHYFNVITLKRYRYKAFARYFAFRRKFDFVFSTNFFNLGRKFFNFETVSSFFLNKLLFNLNLVRLIFVKMFFLGIFLYLYYYVLFHFWRLISGYEDIYTWEYFIFMFIFLYIFLINIVCNPHMMPFPF